MDPIMKSELYSMFLWPFDSEIPYLPHINAFGDDTYAKSKPSFTPKIFNCTSVQCCQQKNTKTTGDIRSIICELCGRSFKNYKGLKQHSGKLHSKNDKIYHCSICEKKFNNKFVAKYHTEQVHQDKKKVMCPLCKLVFYNKYVLEKHDKLMHASNLSDTMDIEKH
ncbi:unnamed protein product [Blepharisma stoltei]|uniref:C2H2-type domain-containing protein n=1 Tax=Blepharisma stoltei TaxID=1481888 RepID=A0AAU9JU41_9CILI|nr:unnamed protein product [Blepharisma stoltei]